MNAVYICYNPPAYMLIGDGRTSLLGAESVGIYFSVYLFN